MADNESILISLESRHADRIYAGTKLVELRRRPMNVSPGTRIWIYEKVPVGSITGSVIVKAVHTGTPKKLWKEFGAMSGLSRLEFFDYFTDVTNACALVLHTAVVMRTPMPLSTLREIDSAFQPPQFFLRLHQEHPVRRAVAAGCGVVRNGAKPRRQMGGACLLIEEAGMK